ncbi:MAG: VWA domain-containing protein [bacterium]|nr:VWA domain-containing protein [bacterium]
MKLFKTFIVVTVLLLILLPLNTRYLEGEEEKGESFIQLILDASGSMNGRLSSGEAKIDAAKKAVKTVMEQLPGHITLAFRAYGHQSHRSKKDCKDTQLLVPFTGVTAIKQQVIDEAQKLKARGYTPITYVLTLAAKDFPVDKPGEKTIILVSDGKETCEGDPCALADSLAASGAKITVHTVGFGVDSATRGQLECIANVTGGKYFDAGNTRELSQVLGKAVKTAKLVVEKKEGQGFLEIKGADMFGHVITNSETGETLKKKISNVKSTVEIPAGIYNVTVGKAVWKSVVVKKDETTTLEPGLLTVKEASLRGHDVLESETGALHGNVSRLKNTITLMPGQYDVMFGPIPWSVKIEKGVRVFLKPGTLKINHAGYRGHVIRNAGGKVVGKVSNTSSWIPLPPGEYTVEINKKKFPFILKEGEEISMDNKE